MGRAVAVLLALGAVAVSARHAGATDACLTSLNAPAMGTSINGHLNADLPNSHNVSYAGTFNIQFDHAGPTTLSYCVDILHHIGFNDCVPQISPTYPCEVVYILNNFYPNAPKDPSLTDAEEAAAVQAAIWYFTDNFHVDGPANIQARAAAVIAAATGQCLAVPPVPQTITLSPGTASNYIPPQTTHTVTATLLDTHGNPIAGYPISIVITGASGNQTFNGTTNGSGQYAVTYANTLANIGTDNITASVSFSIPRGLEFKDAGHQGIVLAGAPQTGTVQGSATKNWIAGTCGDGFLGNSPGEACDDGNVVNGDLCDSNCTPTGCGNGIVTLGEACDDGNATSGDGCDANCTPTGCGNGVVTLGEQCDDGNAVSGDGCDTNCTPTACGNGVVTGSEACDDGNTVNGDTCDNNCTLPGCGNGIVDPGEACDDGNAVNGDACDTNCTVPACGNAIVDPGEACDDGNGTNGDACDTNCTDPGCGNNVVDPGEQCDDGNAVNGDGCDTNCTDPGCGNHVVDPGEACDDGNAVNGDACDNNCTVPGCGNTITDPGEACDDGNAVNGDGCDVNCTVSACGNGIVDPGEQCDDGNANDADACRNSCVSAVCGDGVIRTGVEQCDDGNTVQTDTCLNNCTFNVCGDGVLNVGVEQCDDHNVADGDGCSHDCRLQEICNDLSDNDGDGLIDCDDPDCPTCSPIMRDPAVLKFAHNNKPDKLRISGGVEPSTATDPQNEPVGFLFTNSHGVLFRQILPPGSMTLAGTKVQYLDMAARTGGGIMKLRLYTKKGRLHVKVLAYGSLHAASVPAMSVQLLIGDDIFAVKATWRKMPNGWKFDYRDAGE